MRPISDGSSLQHHLAITKWIIHLKSNINRYKYIFTFCIKCTVCVYEDNELLLVLRSLLYIEILSLLIFLRIFFRDLKFSVVKLHWYMYKTMDKNWVIRNFITNKLNSFVDLLHPKFKIQIIISHHNLLYNQIIYNTYQVVLGATYTYSIL